VPLSSFRPRHILSPPDPKLYSVVVEDDPWPFNDKLPGEGRGADKQYETELTVDQIINRQGFSFYYPKVDDDAILFLWRVSSQVEAAYAAVRARDFVPKSELVWRKLTKYGKRHIGMGHTVRAEHETCIIAVRGSSSYVVRDKSVRSVFEAATPCYEPNHPKVLSGEKKVGGIIHSAKPLEFYAIVEKMCSGPYVELFGRPTTLDWYRPGWTVYGNEIPGGVAVDPALKRKA
jgi:N6-adenosine-specific RNA methylase IME4